MEKKEDGMVKNILILLCLVFFSCGSIKKMIQDKTQTDKKVTETVYSKRKGDTVTVLVPNIMYKDTLITKVGKTTTLNLKYSKNGNLDAECISDEINELKQTITELSEKKDITTKDKETNFNNIIILYIFLGLGFLILVNKLLNKFI